MSNKTFRFFKYCAECGKKFRPTAKIQKCCPNCIKTKHELQVRKQWKKIKQQQVQRTEMFKCVICGIEFERYNPDRNGHTIVKSRTVRPSYCKTCCRECSRKYSKNRFKK